MSKLIYLATPYKHDDKKVRKQRYEETLKIATQLISEGNVVFSPVIYTHENDIIPDDAAWENLCHTLISKSDEVVVYLMDGWNHSDGVLTRIEMAKSMGVPVKFQTYE